VEVLENLFTFGARGRVRQHYFAAYAPLVASLAEWQVRAGKEKSEAEQALDHMLEAKRQAVRCLARVATLKSLPHDVRRRLAVLRPPVEDELRTVTVRQPLSPGDVGLEQTDGGPMFKLLLELGVSSAAAVAAKSPEVLGSAALAKAIAWFGVGPAAGGASLGAPVMIASLVAPVGLAVFRKHLDANRQIAKIDEAARAANEDLKWLQGSTLEFQHVRTEALNLQADLTQQTAACKEAMRRLQERQWFVRLLAWIGSKVAALMRREYRDEMLDNALALERSVNTRVSQVSRAA